MVLTKDEYQQQKEAFCTQHRSAIIAMLKKEKTLFLAEKMKQVTFREFLRHHCTAGFLFLLCGFGFYYTDHMTADVFGLYVFGLLLLHGGIYGDWHSSRRRQLLFTFDGYQSRILMGEYIHDAMVQELSSLPAGDAFDQRVQFYSLALYDIPRSFYINTIDL